MKLRIHKNSLRLRLSRRDVEQIQKTGICAESLRFASGLQLTYTVEASTHHIDEGEISRGLLYCPLIRPGECGVTLVSGIGTGVANVEALSSSVQRASDEGLTAN